MSSSNPHSGRELQMVRGYGTAVLSVLGALLISHWPVFHLESAHVSLFLCAVILSAWFGGVGPGLLAFILSAVAFYYGVLPPVYSSAAKPEEVPRFIAFVFSALFVGSLSVAQRSATESLRRARDDLKEQFKSSGKRTKRSVRARRIWPKHKR